MSSEENISNPRKSSGSSSLSRSSSNDLFQVDTVKLNLTNSEDEQNDVKLNLTNSEDEQNDVSSDSSAKSEVDNTFPSRTSSFDVSNMTHNEMDMSPTQSPPVQMMDRSAGYDPYRIPSSVFATNKSSSLIEWSIASNESLFSLHLGNNSFSTDSASKFDELTKSGEFNVFSPPQLVMREDTDTSKESVETEDSKTFEMGEAFKVEEKASEDHKEVKNSHSAMTPSFSHYTSPSNESRTSEQSFAFPIKKHAPPSCYCSNCTSAFCYYKFPCCLRWPGCYCQNCSWALCYCWKCSQNRCCYDSSPILRKSDRQNFAKSDVPWHPSEEKPSQATSSRAYNGWCGCFSCSLSCTSCCTCGNCRCC